MDSAKYLKFGYEFTHGPDLDKRCEKNDNLLQNKFCEAIDLIDRIKEEISKNIDKDLNLIGELKSKLSELLIEINQADNNAYKYLVGKMRDAQIVKY